MRKNKICVVGLGYVGLTFTGVLLEEEHKVIGLETNSKIIDKIRKGESHFFEPGLDEILKKALKSDNLIVSHPSEKIDLSSCDIFIITVGTPINVNTKIINKDYILEAIDSLIDFIDENKLIILRSTVEVGLTRNLILPYIIEKTGLNEQKINVAFAPERTVEGDALNELRNLPQIFGFNNQKAKQIGSRFFNSFVNEIIFTESLEGAELIKLFNNVYRDINFSIGNIFNDIAKYYGLNGYQVINNANHNYKRSNIAQPGFVGGPCLEKDSYILCQNIEDQVLKNFVISSREYNYSMENQIIDWVCKNFDKSDKILLTGMAFKGRPATGDLRGSSSINILNGLKRHNFSEISIHDFVTDKHELNYYSNTVIDLDLETNDCYELIMILNNHKKYSDKSSVKFLKTKSKQIVDIWNVTNIVGVKTLGNL